MRMFEDVYGILPALSYEEARNLVKQCKHSITCCVVIAGYRAKTKDLYIELQKEYSFRYHISINQKTYPWIVAYKYGCGHLWKDNT